MPLTPSEVRDKQFKIVFRGYHLDDVDAFLDEVEGELSRLLRDNAELRAGAPALPTGGDTPASGEPARPPAAASAPPERPVTAPIVAGESENAALRTLLLAQRTADEAVAEARREAEAILAEARSQASRLDQEVAARRAEAMGDLASRREALEAQIEDLRAFEREYRTRLKAYLETQLHDLAGRSPESGSGVPAAARTNAIAGGGPNQPPTQPPTLAPAQPAASTPAAPAAPPAVPTVRPVSPPVAPAPPAGPRLAPGLSTTAGPEPVGPFTVVPPGHSVEDLADGTGTGTERDA